MAAKESRSVIADAARLYDDDFYDWCISTAKLLRDGRLEEVDLEHVAEEIEDLGKSQHHALDSRTTIIILHLLKMRYQPERHTRSWEKTIVAQRVGIEALLDYNPSLRRFLVKLAGKAYNRAVKLAASETGLPRETFPSTCPFTAQEIFGDELLPRRVEQ
jgi:Domain of unknown function DUF29